MTLAVMKIWTVLLKKEKKEKIKAKKKQERSQNSYKNKYR